MTGSPPLTRGAPIPPGFTEALQRITPAHAGSTGDSAHGGSRSRDHPRSRGEHVSSRWAVRCGRGSPPLTRGARVEQMGREVRSGITPAHAGSTRAAGPVRRRRRDHPRSRGEHAPPGAHVPHVTGSPPLTRGAHDAIGILSAASRITPAHAGSTHSCRMRSTLIEGSPPLTRGALPDRGQHLVVVGITPAHAGSTRPSSMTPGMSRDHPRSRGEHVVPVLLVAGAVGSPPLTRGALSSQVSTPRTIRITPAHAGSTLPAVPGAFSSRDHPRSRGEHSSPPRDLQLTGGSPPLTRGAPRHRNAAQWPARITPAHAGSTSLVWLSSLVVGSPPLTRGAPSDRLPATVPARITPAHAGSTGWGWS